MKQILIIQSNNSKDFQEQCDTASNIGYKVKDTGFYISKDGCTEFKALMIYEDTIPEIDTRAAKFKMDLQQIYNKISTLDRGHLSFLESEIVNAYNEALWKVLDEVSDIIAMAMDRP